MFFRVGDVLKVDIKTSNLKRENGNSKTVNNLHSYSKLISHWKSLSHRASSYIFYHCTTSSESVEQLVHTYLPDIPDSRKRLDLVNNQSELVI